MQHIIQRQVFFVSIIILFCIGSLPMLYSQATDSVRQQTKPDPWLYIGGYAGYNNNIFSADFSKLPNVPNCCPQFKNGTGGGITVGVLAELPLVKFLRLELRAGYTSLGGRLFKSETIGNTSAPNGTNVTVPVDVQYELFSSLNGISIEPVFNVLFFNRVRANVGFRSAILLTKSFRQVETIITPDNAVFVPSQTRTRNANEGDIPQGNAVQNAAVVGVGLDFPVSSRATISPELRYYIPLNDIASVKWNVSTLQLGAAFRYALYPPPPPKFINDTLMQRDTVVKQIVGGTSEDIRLLDRQSNTDEKREYEGNQEMVYRKTTIKEQYQRDVPKIAGLDVQVRTYAVDKSGKQSPIASFIVEETEFEENYPLLPQMFFPDGIGELNASTMKMLTADEAASFSEFALPRNTMDVYAHLLNIVGSRMKARPSSKMTLIGCNSNLGVEKGNRELSARRAESVKRYLTDVWGIEPNRIAVRAQNAPSQPANSTYAEGQEENRRVELYSDDFEILKPVAIKDITVESNPPVVQVVPTVESEAGIQSWTATIEQDGTVLRKLSGTSTPEPYIWTVTDKPYPKLEQPVDVTYTVKDKTNQSRDGSAELKVQQLTLKKKRYEQKDDIRIDRFSLIVFDFNKADLNPDNKKIVQDVKSRIQPQSKITIAGYADKSGDPEYNRELARRRCLEVQKSIGLNDGNSTVNAIGSDVLLYDNSTPQGRAYSRTVQVIIETPVR